MGKRYCLKLSFYFVLFFNFLGSSRSQRLESYRVVERFGGISKAEKKTDLDSNPFGRDKLASGSSDAKKRNNFQSSLIELEDDYDFNVPPTPTQDGDPVQVFFSVNLRNIIQVKAYVDTALS